MSVRTARQGALLALLQVRQRNQRLETALEACLGELTEARERALARELSYGVARWLIRLEALQALLLKRPLKARDADIAVCLQLGLYQILYTRVPAHAAVAESVELARWCGKDWACALVNGVLRRFLRETGDLCRQADSSDWLRLAHPQWLYEAIAQAWPHDQDKIFNADNAHPPLCLRINRRQHSRQQYLEVLELAGLQAQATRHSPDGVRLAKPLDVTLIPGFSVGRVSIQDEAAQLAARILDAQPGQRVLDACAAPGGKTAHLLENAAAGLNLLAIESDPDRLQSLASGLRRLHLEAELRCADARQTANWWSGQAFDRILLDAPCSATGIIRRHPDIRHRRSPAQLRLHRQLQWQLLQALWPTLAPGGKLLYATCSILPQENHLLIQEFLADRNDATVLPMSGSWGREVSPGRQILSGEDDMDGFYYALLGKQI